MPIWTYRDEREHPLTLASESPCAYCGSNLAELGSDYLNPGQLLEGQTSIRGLDRDTRKTLYVCVACGWWVIRSFYREVLYPDTHIGELRASGVLKKLDSADLTLPSEELRQYLTAQYQNRFKVEPRQYEELVAAVFRNVGYSVRLTSFSGDDGIDIFVFDGSDNSLVGVQVKRYRGKIEAEAIRAFEGALHLNGLTRGVFVTTSTFTSGAVRTSRRFGEKGVAIELWDAERFYDRLQIAPCAPYENADQPDAPFAIAWRDVTHLREAWHECAGSG